MIIILILDSRIYSDFNCIYNIFIKLTLINRRLFSKYRNPLHFEFTDSQYHLFFSEPELYFQAKIITKK